jgi:hypothetical protein
MLADFSFDLAYYRFWNLNERIFMNLDDDQDSNEPKVVNWQERQAQIKEKQKLMAREQRRAIYQKQKQKLKERRAALKASERSTKSNERAERQSARDAELSQMVKKGSGLTLIIGGKSDVS